MIVVLAIGLWSARAVSTETAPRPLAEYHFDDPRFVRTADNTLSATRNRLLELVGDSLSYIPSVYIVDSQQEFDSLAGGVFPDWGAAAAYPARGLIAIKNPNKFNLGHSLKELLAHEYTHLVTGHITGMYNAPRWFEEGLSQLVSAEWNWSDNLSMSRAAVFGQFVDLRDIERVNRFDADKAHIAYAQSYLAVKYLFEESGTESVAVFLRSVAEGESHSLALERSTGATYDEFEKDFRLYLNARYNILSLFMDTYWFWLGLAVVLVVGAFLRYRKRRMYYRRWEEEEKLHSTDFDYGDPDHPERVDDEDEPWQH